MTPIGMSLADKKVFVSFMEIKKTEGWSDAEAASRIGFRGPQVMRWRLKGVMPGKFAFQQIRKLVKNFYGGM